MAYYGAKIRPAKTIVSLLPSHELYVEPFAGSLAVLFAKPRATHEIVNDLDGNVVNFWRVLRDRPRDLERACAQTPYSREEYGHAADLDADDDLERARRWWVRISQSFGRANDGRGWSLSLPPQGDDATRTLNYVSRMPAAAERLRRVSIECRDAVDVIRHYDHPKAAMYVDPPYVGDTRTSTGYAVEMASPERHRELADVLHECASAVVLSGYHGPLYDELYGDWQVIELDAISNGGTARTEVLWLNATASERAAQPSLLEQADAEVPA